MDSCYADDLDVAIVAERAGVSKYHFIRSFSAEYGQTPAQYLAHRRIERAQDLLRATNLTVTEVCMLVGYTSLGSFSAKFTALVSETPSAFQQRYGGKGIPHIPGCFVFMRGLRERAIPEKPEERSAY
jgi:transcriptional regulator GlxA family with amidase domain